MGAKKTLASGVKTASAAQLDAKKRRRDEPSGKTRTADAAVLRKVQELDGKLTKHMAMEIQDSDGVSLWAAVHGLIGLAHAKGGNVGPKLFAKLKERFKIGADQAAATPSAQLGDVPAEVKGGTGQAAVRDYKKRDHKLLCMVLSDAQKLNDATILHLRHHVTGLKLVAGSSGQVQTMACMKALGRLELYDRFAALAQL